MVNLNPSYSVSLVMRSSLSQPKKNSACHGPIQLSHGVSNGVVSSRAMPTCGKGRALLESDSAEIQPGPHQCESVPP